MKLKFLLFFYLIINLLNAQESNIYNDFENYFNGSSKDRLSKTIENYQEYYLDSIFNYSVSNWLKEEKIIRNMKNLEEINFYEGFLKSFKHKSLTKNTIEIPSSIKFLFFWGSVPLPLPINFHLTKNKLEVLYFADIYFDSKNQKDSNFYLLDFSYLDSLKEFGYNYISNWTNTSFKIKILLPQNLISFSGYIDSNYSIYSFPHSIEKMDVIFGDSIPKDFFELPDLKILYIDNYLPLSEDFLKFKKIQKLKITHLTTSDIKIIKQMPKLDTLYWQMNIVYKDIRNYISEIPIEAKDLTVKCIVLRNSNNFFILNGYAEALKSLLPNTRVFYFSHKDEILEFTE
jgi:hypothetical protein